MSRDALRTALEIAWSIIEVNPTEDTCRHGNDADECDEQEGCADRSRRETIRAALSSQADVPSDHGWEAYKDAFPAGRNIPESQADDPSGPEATCQRCGRPNVPAWSAPADLWNEVMGGETGILCPPCFAELADEDQRMVWRFTPVPAAVPDDPWPSPGFLEQPPATSDSTGGLE